LIAALLLSSCAPVISQETLKRARTDVPFGAVAADPLAYRDSLFVWGGTIIRTSTAKDGSVIEVVQSPVDRYGAVKDADVSEGRFLVRARKFLDPEIYKKNRQVTVAGVLIGMERRQLGEAEYTYPVLEAREIYLWKEAEPYYSPYYYSPYYYPYYDPWYWDPRWHWGRYPFYCDPFWDPWCR